MIDFPTRSSTWQTRRHGRLWQRLVCCLLFAALLSGCGGPSVFDAQGPIAAANSTVLLNSLAIMLVIVIPTIAGCLAFAWWFRARNERARFRPDFVFSGRLELLVWSVPLLVILFLGGITLIGSRRLDPFRPLASKEAPLEIQVVALDWKWLFIYPEQHVASVNSLVVPVGEPISLKLTSSSVMNSFFVPQLGGMIAVMNGMETQLHLAADRAGDYYGQSAQFSGDGFADMNFTVHAIDKAHFLQWAKTVSGTGPTLDSRSYAELAHQSRHVAPFTYGSVQDDIFERVLSQQQPSGPGPQIVFGGRAFSDVENP